MLWWVTKWEKSRNKGGSGIEEELPPLMKEWNYLSMEDIYIYIYLHMYRPNMEEGRYVNRMGRKQKYARYQNGYKSKC